MRCAGRVLRARQSAAGQAGRRGRNPFGRTAGRPRGASPGAGLRGARAVEGLAGQRRHPVPATAGPHIACELEDAAQGPDGQDLQRSGVSADSGRGQRHPQARAQGPRLGGPAHARGRRQCAHQHPRQQRRLRHAADRARGGSAHHGAGAQPGRRDLGRARHRHHQAGIPLGCRAGTVCRLQEACGPRRPLQQGQADPQRRVGCPGAPESRRSLAARVADVCRPDQCLHAQLRPDGL
ncbi:hypothetical protein SDC9_115557 [bioreactor metagenome]|uniref:Uncharacterized protein n=1 Tax=bioreactor metagenome TaxID=1076179 RepID=A0A645BZU9_9ZZZZ